MSDDSFSTVTSQSWFSRIAGSIVGALVGILLFLASFVVLGWNESRAVNREKTLAVGAKQVVHVDGSPVDPANEGRLVHVTANATGADDILDKTFDFQTDALKLRRTVEMYQWTEEKTSETHNKLGGGQETVTKTSYVKKWSPSLVDSSSFAKPDGHKNPAQMPVEGREFVAPELQVGDFALSEELLSQLSQYEPVELSGEDADRAASATERNVKVASGALFFGGDPSEPAVGDFRVSFSVVPSGPYSVVAQQSGQGLRPYDVKGLGTIAILRSGEAPADAMFAAEKENNVFLTWLLRFIGFFMMLFGLNLIAGPLKTVADFVPFIGSIVGGGIGFIALGVALPLSLITIALAWVAVRPLIGLPLLFAALGLGIFGFTRLRKQPSPATGGAA